MPASDGADRPTLADRLRRAFLKPEDPGAAREPAARPASAAELEAAVRSADDKERAIGLIGAPVGALISMLVIGALVSDDPAARLRNGRPNPLHVSVAVYHEVLVVLLALSVVMLVTALLRKRLFLGIAMALYGLAIFNLHYWGFGIPFLMAGAWLLVRAYRLQRDLREAGGAAPGRQGPGGSVPRTGRPGPARPNKRYTPRSSSPRRPGSDKRRRAG